MNKTKRDTRKILKKNRARFSLGIKRDKESNLFDDMSEAIKNEIGSGSRISESDKSTFSKKKSFKERVREMSKRKAKKEPYYYKGKKTKRDLLEEENNKKAREYAKKGKSKSKKKTQRDLLEEKNNKKAQEIAKKARIRARLKQKNK